MRFHAPLCLLLCNTFYFQLPVPQPPTLTVAADRCRRLAISVKLQPSRVLFAEPNLRLVNQLVFPSIYALGDFPSHLLHSLKLFQSCRAEACAGRSFFWLYILLHCFMHQTPIFIKVSFDIYAFLLTSYLSLNLFN